MEQSTYANSVAIAMSHMDIRLIFTAREPKLSIDGNIESEDRAEVARIAMSLPVAKRLNKMQQVSFRIMRRQTEKSLT